MGIVLPMCIMAFLGVVGVMQASGSVRNSHSATDAVALEATLLLTVTAMRFNYAEMVPKSQLKPTLLDKYIISVMVLLAATTLGVVVFHEEELGLVRAPWLYTGVVVLVHVYFGICAWHAGRIPAGKKGELLYCRPHGPPESTSFDQPLMRPLGFAAKSLEV